MARLTLKTYIEILNKYAEQNPDCLEHIVLDNRYNPIHGGLFIEQGYFKNGGLRENTFIPQTRFEDITIDENQCVNSITIC